MKRKYQRDERCAWLWVELVHLAHNEIKLACVNLTFQCDFKRIPVFSGVFFYISFSSWRKVHLKGRYNNFEGFMKLIYFLKSQQKNSSKCHREHLAKYELKIWPIRAFSRRVYGARKKWDEKKNWKPAYKSIHVLMLFVWFSFILFSGCSSCDLFSVIFRSVASIFIDVLRRHWIAVRFRFRCVLYCRARIQTPIREDTERNTKEYIIEKRVSLCLKNVL